MKTHRLLLLVFGLLVCQLFHAQSQGSASQERSNKSLNELFAQWRIFETPPLRDGAPDYTEVGRQERWGRFLELEKQLEALDTASWPIADQVDWMLVRAEMNGYRFNEKILQPWKRDPAFYKSVWLSRSDVPAHEGPTHHRLTELWQYKFPLDQKSRSRLISDLQVIPAINKQAQKNLTGNAKELWIAGIRDIETQLVDLLNMGKLPGVLADKELMRIIGAALESTTELIEWLRAEAPKKTGPSGIGKEAYTWYLQNVHLVPMTWEDEVLLLKRELARAWSSLKLEEHRNRHLPELKAATSPTQYDSLANAAARNLIDFLDQQNIVTVASYFEPALREHLGAYVPVETRNFFWIATHYDPRPLYSHFYHWFELARMDTEPNPRVVRQGPLLYNIFDSRNEGVATAVEETFMQAGLYDNQPRSKEIVYIMIAQRAARGLGSLYAHANEMTMEEAGGIHSEYTPRGWMKTEPELLRFEQHLYMRQPGYGTSYITGKYLFEQTMMEAARISELKGVPFSLQAYMDQLNSIGNIPISLSQWEMTGIKPTFSSVSFPNNP